MGELEQTVPMFLRRLHTDEFRADVRGPRQRRVRWDAHAGVGAIACEKKLPEPLAAATRRATAVGLRALNREWGAEFYEVPEDAARSEEAASEAFGRVGPVVDVQTHFLAPHSAGTSERRHLRDVPGGYARWWTEMDDIVGGASRSTSETCSWSRRLRSQC